MCDTMGVGIIFFQGDFSKIFPGGPKVVKFVFSLTELRKQPFFAKIFTIQRTLVLPYPPFRRPCVTLGRATIS